MKLVHKNLLIAIVPLVCLAGGTVVAVREATEVALSERALMMAQRETEHVAAVIGRAVGGHREQLRILARHPGFGSGAAGGRLSTLAEVSSKYRQSLRHGGGLPGELAIGELDGGLYRSGDPPETWSFGSDRARLERGEIVQKVLGEARGRLALRTLVPIRDGEQLIAVLVSRIEAHRFADLMEEHGLRRDGFTALLDGHGRVFAVIGHRAAAVEALAEHPLRHDSVAHVDAEARVLQADVAGGLGWHLVTGLPKGHVAAAAANVQGYALGLAGVVALVAFAVVLVVSRETRRPLRQLSVAVQAFAETRKAEFVEARGTGEVAELARAFNRMASEVRHLDTEKDRNRSALERAARLESVGQLAGGVAHDFNNLLTAIVQSREAAETALDGGEVEEVRDLLVDIETAAARGSDLTHQLLAFARRHPSSPKVLDVGDVARRTLTSLRRALPAGLDLELETTSAPASTRFDPKQLEQVLSNLVAFSRDSMRGSGSKIVVSTSVVTVDAAMASSDPELQAGEYALLEVADDGPGLPPDAVSRVFEPFVVMQPGPGSHGLGLATVYGLVRQHGGFINVTSTFTEGTTFRVYLPRTDAEPVGRKSRLSVEHPAAGHETILVVEDERSVARAIARNLRRLGYEVWEAENGAHALLELGERSRTPHLVLTDVVMPRMGGDELYRQLRESHPKLPVLFMSGYTANALEEDGVLHEGVQLLRKPFTMDQLGRRIRSVLGASQGASARGDGDQPDDGAPSPHVPA